MKRVTAGMPLLLLFTSDLQTDKTKIRLFTLKFTS